MAQKERIDLGTTKINLPIPVKSDCVPADTSTYPAMAHNRDDNAPVPTGALSITAEVGKGAPDGSSYVAELKSTGVGVFEMYDVAHGPALVSGAFMAEAGDRVSFDWKAVRGIDDYHVFGYLVDTDCAQTKVLDDTGADSGWSTTSTAIPKKGQYALVLVNGTYDSNGDRDAGASLFVDNLRLGDQKVTDAVAQQIARRLMYANSSTNPPATRTVTVTAHSSNNGVGSADITVEITPVDDPPALEAIDPVTFTNTVDDDAFGAVIDQLAAVDPEGDPVTFGLVDGVAEAVKLGLIVYTHHKVGAYGTLYVDSVAGHYRFEPNAAAINARTTDATETFTLSATAEGLTSTRPLTVNVLMAGTVPGAPTALAATAGRREGHPVVDRAGVAGRLGDQRLPGRVLARRQGVGRRGRRHGQRGHVVRRDRADQRHAGAPAGLGHQQDRHRRPVRLGHGHSDGPARRARGRRWPERPARDRPGGDPEHRRSGHSGRAGRAGPGDRRRGGAAGRGQHQSRRHDDAAR